MRPSAVPHAELSDLHGWEHGYDETTVPWDDALAARAMQELRDARMAATRAEAERKKKAAEAALAAKQQPAAAKRTQPMAPMTAPAGKKQRVCSDCGQPATTKTLHRLQPRSWPSSEC